MAQRAWLHLNLAKLVGRAAPDENISNIPEDYNHILWTGQTDERIKAYLEPAGVFEAFQATFRLYESFLEEIAEKLVAVSRPPKVCLVPHGHCLRSKFRIRKGKRVRSEGTGCGQQTQGWPLPFQPTPGAYDERSEHRRAPKKSK